jgi:ParB/RepB/Spo0J family partition protein
MSKPALPPRRAPLHPVDWVTQHAGVEDLPGAKLIAVGLLDPNPFQPRTTFDQAALEDLAASIREHGVLQPLTVRQADDRYQIGAGERRWRAAQRAGLADVPCVVRTLSDEEMEVLALIENVQRADLDPLDEAHAYRRLMDRFGLSLRDVAGRVAKSHEHVARRLRLIADPAVEAAVRAGTVGPTIAAELARIEDPERRRALLGRAEAGARLTLKDVAPSPPVTYVTGATDADVSPAPSLQNDRDYAPPVTYATAAPSPPAVAPMPSRTPNEGGAPVTYVTDAVERAVERADPPLTPLSEPSAEVADPGQVRLRDLRLIQLREGRDDEPRQLDTADRATVLRVLRADLAWLEDIDRRVRAGDGRQGQGD